MKLQLVARHLRDDQDIVIDEAEHPDGLVELMKLEIEANRAEGSNWRYSIQPTEEAYAI